MQNYIDEMVVQPDGTINTKSGWDEHGRRFGIYKDGKVLGNEDLKINGDELGTRVLWLPPHFTPGDGLRPLDAAAFRAACAFRTA